MSARLSLVCIPIYAVASDDIPGHTVEFREVCMTPAGLAVVVDGAKALAMTVVDLLATPSLLEQAWSEFRSAVYNS